jgi:hypothetical protein
MNMTKPFRPWDPKQKWLLPPEITEFIPEGHASHFVRDLVVAQVIVACDVVATSADCPQLLPMVDRIKANLGRKPDLCSADAGYCHGLPSVSPEGPGQGSG